MTSATDPFEALIAGWAFHGDDMPTAHTSVFVALHTGDPNADGDATTEPGTENEVTATDYARVDVPTSSANWPMNTADQQQTVIENGSDISFGIASSNWGTISHFSLWTGDQGDSSAEVLLASNVASSQEITENDQVRFPAGSLSAELD